MRIRRSPTLSPAIEEPETVRCELFFLGKERERKCERIKNV